MKKSLFLSILFTCLFVTAAFASPAWQWVTSDNLNSYYFNRAALTEQAANADVLNIRIKKVFNAEGQKEALAFFDEKYPNASAAEKAAFAKISYSIVKYKFDLAQNKAMLLSETFYNEDGKKITEYTNNEPQFENVKAGSPEAKEINGIKSFLYFSQLASK